MPSPYSDIKNQQHDHHNRFFPNGSIVQNRHLAHTPQFQSHWSPSLGVEEYNREVFIKKTINDNVYMRSLSRIPPPL